MLEDLLLPAFWEGFFAGLESGVFLRVVALRGFFSLPADDLGSIGLLALDKRVRLRGEGSFFSLFSSDRISERSILEISPPINFAIASTYFCSAGVARVIA